MIELFNAWMDENTDPCELCNQIQSMRESTPYTSQLEYTEGLELDEWSTWDEYVDEMCGYNYGYRDVFESCLEAFEKAVSLIVEDEVLIEELYEEFYSRL